MDEAIFVENCDSSPFDTRKSQLQPVLSSFFFKEKPIPCYTLFCPSSWATGLCEDLIKQNDGDSIQYKVDGADKKCKGHRQDSNLRYL
ncbi:hypothetical protein J6590_082682 [Homalodisca vitripennis]|nr:hypothetical protein J6590_082682 [Homalodisca vitripennis]